MIMNAFMIFVYFFSILSALLTGSGSALSASVLQGCQAGVTLAISICGSLCLWCGIGNLMEKTKLTEKLSRLFRPLLHRIFPSSKKDPLLAGSLSANISANLLGLGNAATPMGIRAVKQMQVAGQTVASDEMCRLIVLNTASIQLIPANVAAVRASLGCSTPFDILGAVWVTSVCSASAGLLAAFVFGKVWRNA